MRARGVFRVAGCGLLGLARTGGELGSMHGLLAVQGPGSQLKREKLLLAVAARAGLAQDAAANSVTPTTHRHEERPVSNQAQVHRQDGGSYLFRGCQGGIPDVQRRGRAPHVLSTPP